MLLVTWYGDYTDQPYAGGEDVVAVEDDYWYSDVERALYKRIVEYMTGHLKGWI